MATQAQEDGYIECTECGHPVEQHTEDGCEVIAECACTVAWTPAQIRRFRLSEGLPARWGD